jgi:WhiB family redox-sensing transcriptional regulator
VKYHEKILDITWMEDAGCREAEPEQFYYENEQFQRKLVEQYCKLCLVKNQCLEYALAHEDRFGVWGGTTARQRKEILNKKPLGTAALSTYRR